MHVRKRLFTFLFAALAMVLLSACGKWDYSREAMKAANEAQGETLRVEFKVNQTFTNALRAAAEDNIQPADVDKAMTMDKSIEKLLSSGYRLDVYVLRADIDADKAAAQLADEFVNRLAGCEDEGYISMVKADNSYFYMAVLTYKHDSGSSDGGAGDDGGASGGDEDDGFTGRWVDWNATTQTLKILPRASEKIGDTLTEDGVKEALEAQGEPTEGFSFFMVKNLHIDGQSGIKTIGDNAFVAPDGGENCTLKYADLSGVETVGTMSFGLCTSLTTVEGTENLKTVKEMGFFSCWMLVGANFKTVTKFETYAFDKCWKLTQDDFDLSKIETMEEGALAETGITDISDLNSAINELPDYAFYGTKLTSVDMSHVTKLGVGAFGDCKQLTSVTLSQVEALGNRAFEDCISLASISLPQAETFGEDVFNECTNLTSISLCNAISIGENCFMLCENLAWVDLPKIETIGKMAFYLCDRLAEIRLGEDISSVGRNVFEDVGTETTAKTFTIYYGPNQEGTSEDQISTVIQNSFTKKTGESLYYMGHDNYDTVRWVFKPESKFEHNTCPATYSISNPAARFILNL